jgi:Phytanoyl-CoA dioxygenase (PhyH)
MNRQLAEGALGLEFDRQGYALLERALETAHIERLRALLPQAPQGEGVRSRNSVAYAARHLLWTDFELRIALSECGVDDWGSRVLGGEAFPINATLFDKCAGANWGVPEHQDLLMPVAARVDEAGFTGWCEKQGCVYVEPPTDVLERLVALRIHLDDCPADNGALGVVPGSHRRGKIRSQGLNEIAAEEYGVCPAHAGDILAMRPLLVHRSFPAAHPGRRRVLHVVYAAAPPGKIVRWKTAAPSAQVSVH